MNTDTSILEVLIRITDDLILLSDTDIDKKKVVHITDIILSLVQDESKKFFESLHVHVQSPPEATNPHNKGDS